MELSAFAIPERIREWDLRWAVVLEWAVGKGLVG